MISQFDPVASAIEGNFGAVLGRNLALAAAQETHDGGYDLYRRGNVLELIVSENFVLAAVRGTQLQPFEVVLRLPLLSDERRTRALERLLAADGSDLRSLLVGRAMTAELVGLILQDSDLDFRTCSCAASAPLCRHIVAMAYALAEHCGRTGARWCSLRGLDLEAVISERTHALSRSGQSATRGRGSHRHHEPQLGTRYDAKRFWGDTEKRIRPAVQVSAEPRVRDDEELRRFLMAHSTPYGEIATQIDSCFDIVTRTVEPTETTSPGHEYRNLVKVQGG